MKQIAKLALGLMIGIIAVLFGLGGKTPAYAAPQGQTSGFATPTPGADGRILYTVQSGDTWYGIAVAAGISLDELYALNNKVEGDTLIAGSVIVLGVSQEAAATAQARYAGQPTPTAITDSAAICVLLYLDANGDSVRDYDEIPMAGGVVSVNEQSGLFTQQATTTYSYDPLCFRYIPLGSYQVSLALPEGYYRTTELGTEVALAAGDTATFIFGMSPNQVDLSRPGGGGGGGPDPILLVGGALLMLGAGVGIYAAVANRGDGGEGE